MTKISNTIRVKTGENSFEDEIKVSYIEPNYSAAEGKGTIASSSCQHVEGKYNIEDTENKYIHIAGNGNDDTGEIVQSNAHTLDWDGNVWFAGDVTYGATNSKLTRIDLLKDFVKDPINEDILAEGFSLNFHNNEKYDAFMIISAYSPAYLRVANTLIIPIEEDGTGNGVANIMWKTNAVRLIGIIQDEDGVQFDFDSGSEYQSYNGGLTSGAFCIPKKIYGIKNINQ